MSDTTLINQLRSLGDEGFPVCWRAADALEQQAAQIAEKDAEIARLTECLSKANANHEHFERAWYLRADEVEALRADAERLRASLAAIHWRSVAGRFDEIAAKVIHGECEHAIPALAALRQEQPT